MAKAKNEAKQENLVKDENVTKDVNENKTVTSEDTGANATVKNEADTSDKQLNSVDNREENEVEEAQEFVYLAEAYQRMLRGEVFRFKEWDKLKIPYVAFVKRGQTKIMIAKDVDSNNAMVFKPSQEEALKKLWYQVK